MSSHLTSVLHGLREYWTPVLTESKFYTHAVLTPAEFVAAGDYLVYKCPTWHWEKGDPGKVKEYLPSDKQFLITRNVPCMKRVRELEYHAFEQTVETDQGENEAWIATHYQRPQVPLDDDLDSDVDYLEDMTHPASPGTPAHPETAESIPDLDELVGNVHEESDGDVLHEAPTHAAAPRPIARPTRTYDLSITYDKYYQTPRLSLMGYDEHKHPLAPPLIFQDISQDHAYKTVTLDPHPHLPLQVVSIHPCRHAEMMKKFLHKWSRQGTEVRVDQYLVFFLKFMASILPTMDYDHTMALN